MKNNFPWAFLFSLLLAWPAHAIMEQEIVKCDVCTNANCPVGSQDAKNLCYIVYSRNLSKPECSGWKEPHPLRCGKYAVYSPPLSTLSSATAPTTATTTATTQTWVCENAWGYRYFSSMMKCKGMQEKDGSCNFNSSGSLAMGCKYDYSLPPVKKAATPSPPVVSAPPAQEEPPPVVAAPKTSTLELLKQAEAEKKAALASTASLKETISGIKKENLSVADQLKTGKMDVGSYAKWNPYSSTVSGDLGENGEYDDGSLAGSSGGKGGGKSDRSESVQKSKNRRGSGITEKNSLLDQEGRGLASEKSGDPNASSSNGKNGKSGASQSKGDESTDAWITYLQGNEKANLLNQLRMDPKLREKLKARLDELMASGDQSSSTFGFLTELYEESAISDPQQMADLNAMSMREAFSMDDEETRRQINELLGELELSDPQFLPQESLFERIQWAHKKFAKKEFFRANKK